MMRPGGAVESRFLAARAQADEVDVVTDGVRVDRAGLRPAGKTVRRGARGVVKQVVVQAAGLIAKAGQPPAGMGEPPRDPPGGVAVVEDFAGQLQTATGRVEPAGQESGHDFRQAVLSGIRRLKGFRLSTQQHEAELALIVQSGFRGATRFHIHQR